MPGKPTARWFASATLLLALLIVAASILATAFGFGTESDELKANPNYSPAYEQRTKAAADIATTVFLCFSLLPTVLLAKLAALKWPRLRIVRWLGSFMVVIATSYAFALMSLMGFGPLYVRAIYDALRRGILTYLGPL
jgi:hypothetical protein